MMESVHGLSAMNPAASRPMVLDIPIIEMRNAAARLEMFNSCAMSGMNIIGTMKPNKSTVKNEDE